MSIHNILFNRIISLYCGMIYELFIFSYYIQNFKSIRKMCLFIQNYDQNTVVQISNLVFTSKFHTLVSMYCHVCPKYIFIKYMSHLFDVLIHFTK